ncbi:MAG: OprO/OprP family phosphate-selective porin [candidate division KSB1 bacterium]|nr:OprO/OprP family phosphate-selective porin [candidate division KSB1 bacterium]MDZ7273301.1 OprO/OprP family phosphate-selective porin [candidate division KSB1 bacterium]MDZ7285403.1 OprO/OprP family phosphate-selective porin [candidate division KSB1 bacterium]MDZ7298435.1 OprO/OprP family phosphate-selective porin [candidate division KSB1 bacterium]MDZ7308534.1 OprO/OprP family phosphate-selective porin [candidate division KSB1 bacterium]
MQQRPGACLAAGLCVLLSATSNFSQEVKSRHAESWELAGSIQLQHLYNPDFTGDSRVTDNGFRMRRGRLSARGRLNAFVDATMQIEVRDNSPRLKDAEGRIKLANSFYLRFGQFKVPVWREELRSSTNLLLIERSAAAEFLVVNNFSARQIGLEFGRRPERGLQIALNISNGAGEGIREDAGRPKSDFVNNGKLLTGRLNLPLGERVHIGVSAAANRVTRLTQTAGGNVTVAGMQTLLAPDVGLYLHHDKKTQFDLEGGVGVGKLAREVAGGSAAKFLLADLSGRWLARLSHPLAGLGGLDALELAASVCYLEPDDRQDNEFIGVRFGPAIHFGRSSRLQINGEWDKPLQTGGQSVLQVRSQINFIF